MNNLLYDQQEKKSMGLVNCSKVYVEKSKYGFGVFARQEIKSGEII